MVQEQAVPETPDIVIGNTTLKYTAKNPAIRFLTERWLANLERVVEQVAADPLGEPKRVLEVGCGEGVIADKLHRRFGEVVALDLPDAGLRAWWQDYPGPGYLHAEARVSRRHVIFSVPREPVFRGCNLVAGRYVSDLGNTPGHLNHWSKRSFTKFVGTVADVHGVTTPFPWTTVRATVRR